MDRRIRHVAALLTVLLLAISLSAGWIQGIRAESIATYEPASPTDPTVRARNRFRIFQECRWERGPILSVDGRTLAESRRTSGGTRCLYERVYPSGDLASQIVGQWSLHYGKTGLEAAYNEDLVGAPLPPRSFEDLLESRPRVGHTLVSTIDARLQTAARDALEGRRGGVVAMNPKTGAVYVAASNPSYDPAGLSSNDRIVAARARCRLGLGVELDANGNEVRGAGGEPIECENAQTPMVSVALQARRPPGSSFKVVTAAAALESGKYTPDTSTPVTSSYTPPGDTRDIGNFGGGSCGGSLANALRVSCNTAFARIAVDVGEEQLFTTAQAMGLDRFGGRDFIDCEAGSPSDISEARAGCLPSRILRRDAQGNVVGEEKLSTAAFRARAGFGQWVLQTSPFGMAMVASTVANGGFVPRPRFGERIVDRTGATIKDIRTGVGPAAMSAEAAGQLAQMMRGVVSSGTASGAFGGFDVPVAGKTGTAQQPSCSPDEVKIFGQGCGRLPHAWFIAFAPVEDPAIAVAVLIERGGGNNEAATGGRLAAPVARKVLETYFRLYPARAGVRR